MTQNIEERLSVVESQIRRVDGHALSTANGLATLEQGQQRLERGFKALQGEVKVGFVSIRDQLNRIHDKKQRAAASIELSHEDFEETASGTHYKVTKDTVTRVLAAQREHEDAQAWRALWKRARWFVWIVLGGAGTLAGDRLVQLLLKHL